MAENRIPREAQSREQAERPKTWKPAELLPEVAREPGYAYHWVRVTLNGAPDQRNFSAKLREGWEPVTTSEQPQMRMFLDPTSRFKDNIEVGGLLLCKSPQELVDQRNAHYADQNRQQVEGVDGNYMRQSDRRMPLFSERKSSTSFGNGS
jgi:hypothetical protein